MAAAAVSPGAGEETDGERADWGIARPGWDSAAAGWAAAEREDAVDPEGDRAVDREAVGTGSRIGGLGESAAQDRRAELYLEVQASAAFAEVRHRYRRFVFPAAAGFVSWYLLYVVAATTAPGLMGHQMVGELNVAMVAGLAQFATTFVLTWAYARHARLRRDQPALDLRWTLATRTEQERVR